MCKKQKPHQFLIDKKLGHIIPYKNEETATNIYGDPIISSITKKPYTKMDAWRINSHGVQARFKKTNFSFLRISFISHVLAMISKQTRLPSKLSNLILKLRHQYREVIIGAMILVIA